MHPTDSVFRGGEGKKLYRRYVGFTFATFVLLAGLAFQANAAGVTKTSSFVHCSPLCDDPQLPSGGGAPHPVSGTVGNVQVFGMVDPSTQTVTATVSTSAGETLSGKINFATHTIYVWTARGYVKAHVYRQNGYTYVKTYVAAADSLSLRSTRRPSANFQDVPPGGFPQMLRSSTIITDDEGNVVAVVAGPGYGTAGIVLGSHSSILVPSPEWTADHWNTISGCAGLALGGIASIVAGAASGGWSVAASIGLFAGGTSGYFSRAYDDCI